MTVTPAIAYVLMLVIGAPSFTSTVSMQEFSSQLACEDAKAVVLRAREQYSSHVTVRAAQCVPK